MHSHTFADLGLTAPDRLSDFAYCEPFQLISEAGVGALFTALASDPVQTNCKFTSLRTPWCAVYEISCVTPETDESQPEPKAFRD